MLTATYTLVALSVEQASLRLSLQSMQHYVRSTLMQQNRISLSQLEYASETLSRLYQACQWRKTEMYLIPAIRMATERADQLLEELNRLTLAALGVIRGLQEKVDSLADLCDDQVAQICEAIDSFCTTLLQRLEKEEQELFALARSAIAGDVWFSIANQLMMHDKHLEEMRRAMAAPPKPAQPGSPAGVAALSKPVGRPSGEDGKLDFDVLDRPITIPAMQVLPIVNLDAQAVLPPSHLARQHRMDEILAK